MTRLDWSRDGADWPHRDASRFVEAGGIRWHVQVASEGPTILLLHGTGAASHSFAAMLPLLAGDHRVIVPDLPGHGFTAPRPSGIASLPWMAGAVSALLDALGEVPALIVGHSAGAAVAARMALDRLGAAPIVAINGALLPFPGMMQLVAPALAKLLFLNPLAPRLMAWRAAAPGAVEKMIAATGSRLPPAQMRLYARLFGNAAHCDAALSMMANWDLETLAADLQHLPVPMALIAASRDGFVPPARAEATAARIPRASIEWLEGLGHLAHEEDAAAVAAIVRAVAAATGSATAPAAPRGAPPRAASGTAA